MKFVHLSDLHVGKKLREHSLGEDQKFILDRIIGICADEKPDAVLIAGDVYDKSDPSAEAVTLFNGFLTKLKETVKEIFIISGNHDSPERLSFGGGILKESGVYISPVYSGAESPVMLKDEYGEVAVYSLPFVKPSIVRRAFGIEDALTYTEALKVCVDAMNIDTSRRNVLITHQFVTGADRTESEDISVGGADNVDGEVFSAFDYVALGHIHRAQNVGTEKIRYSGTPLKYSFGEVNDVKSVTVAELKEKGTLNVRTIPLSPLRDLEILRGDYSSLMEKSFYETKNAKRDIFKIVLTDENDVPDAISRLRIVYPNIAELVYDNSRTRSAEEVSSVTRAEEKTPLELFNELFKKQNGGEPTDEQSALVQKLINDVWGE